jgi:hypothetical protein
VSILTRIPNGSEHIVRLVCARPSSLNDIVGTLLTIIHRQLTIEDVATSASSRSQQSDVSSDIKRSSSQTFPSRSPSPINMNMNGDTKRSSPIPSTTSTPSTTSSSAPSTSTLPVLAASTSRLLNPTLIGATRSLWHIAHLSPTVASIIRTGVARLLTLLINSTSGSTVANIENNKQARHYCSSFALALSVSVINDAIDFVTRIFTRVHGSGQLQQQSFEWPRPAATAFIEYLHDRRNVVAISSSTTNKNGIEVYIGCAC